MSDLFNQVTDGQDPISKILQKVPGFSGYMERQNRRASDKLLRGIVADQFEEQWQRISALQRDLISGGGIDFIDDLESAAIKIRQFVDRIRTATYGYSGMFDAAKVNQEELEKLYNYDLVLLKMVDEIARAIDNVEASIGSDGLSAAIRNLTSLAQDCVVAFNQRSEVILGSAEDSSQ
jgi:hypothetical protein